jgi:hypothetical protein
MIGALSLATSLKGQQPRLRALLSLRDWSAKKFRPVHFQRSGESDDLEIRNPTNLAFNSRDDVAAHIPAEQVELGRKCGLREIPLAAALNIPVRVVKAYMNLPVGIHAEVADLLKDKNIAPGTLRLLRRVNAVRQVEIAELMVGTNS